MNTKGISADASVRNHMISPQEELLVDGCKVRIYYSGSPGSQSLEEVEKVLQSNFTL